MSLPFQLAVPCSALAARAAESGYVDSPDPEGVAYAAAAESEAARDNIVAAGYGGDMPSWASEPEKDNAPARAFFGVGLSQAESDRDQAKSWKEETRRHPYLLAYQDVAAEANPYIAPVTALSWLHGRLRIGVSSRPTRPGRTTGARRRRSSRTATSRGDPDGEGEPPPPPAHGARRRGWVALGLLRPEPDPLVGADFAFPTVGHEAADARPTITGELVEHHGWLR